LGESVLNTTPVKKTHKRWDSGEFYTLPDEERSMAKTNSRQDLLDTLQWGSELVDSAQRRPRRSSLSVEKLSPN
jgi:L-rhamnose isomerase